MSGGGPASMPSKQDMRYVFVGPSPIHASVFQAQPTLPSGWIACLCYVSKLNWSNSTWCIRSLLTTTSTVSIFYHCVQHYGLFTTQLEVESARVAATVMHCFRKRSSAAAYYQ